MPKSLDDIFNDDEFGLLDQKQSRTLLKTDQDRLLESFLEINTFYEKNGREPAAASMSEYRLLSVLKNFRTNDQHKTFLKEYDKFNLLGAVDNETNSLEDIFKDDTLGILETDSDQSIFTFNHTPKPGSRASADYTAQRQPMTDEEFKPYENLFRQVHLDLKSGKRKLTVFKNPETNLQEGKFYLLDGLLTYLEISNAERTIMEEKGVGRIRLEGRTLTIFENATKSNLLFRSLGKALLNNGKTITDNIDSTENKLLRNAGVVSEEDQKSGWIYILKSKSSKPEISQLQHLFKIGFSATDVRTRLKNAVQESTYLFAEVEIVATYKCYNLNPRKFESLIHRVFGGSCLDIDLYDNKGHRINPREWFVVPLPAIDEAINLIISGGILSYKYDATLQKMVLR